MSAYSIIEERKKKMSAYSIVEGIVNKGKARDEKAVPFVCYEPFWTLEEIVLRNAVKESLEDAISFCLNKDTIVREWDLGRFLKGTGGCLGINLYGEPGTGKSIAAEAIAKRIGRSIVRVKLSEMLDSLQGNTEKNLTALFKAAEEKGWVILFDEADSLLSRRASAGSTNAESNNNIKSHMLNLLDWNNAIVIFTTNFFKNYDRAFIRRILFNIGFPNPSFEELVSLWNFHLNENVPKNVTYEELATLSDGLTGGDIKKLTLTFCVRLSSGRIRKIDSQTVRAEIERYKKSIDASKFGLEKSENGDVGKEVPDSYVPAAVKKALY